MDFHQSPSASARSTALHSRFLQSEDSSESLRVRAYIGFRTQILLFLLSGPPTSFLTSKLGLHSNTFIHNILINIYAKRGSINDARLLFEACPSLDPVSCNIMVSGFVKAGQLNNARKLFDIMPGKGCVSFTTMKMGLVQNDCFREALEVFNDMMSDGVVPNDLTLVNVICACSHFGEILNYRMIHALAIKLFVEGLVLVSTNLMRVYFLCSGVGEARRLFEKMPEVNLVSWNVTLNGYAKAGRVDMARSCLREFLIRM
ncbi:hypothetical protein Fmac_009175 [Flemingia macrophylla]|uniref:Pentatricopeptide repeat-containing protein n=1 Tax=Flemingia macrophylla TaxID=520843 RepID=A0ABD1MZH8_9FABA